MARETKLTSYQKKIYNRLVDYFNAKTGNDPSVLNPADQSLIREDIFPSVGEFIAANFFYSKGLDEKITKSDEKELRQMGII